jgi:subtilisin family serine protease
MIGTGGADQRRTGRGDHPLRDLARRRSVAVAAGRGGGTGRIVALALTVLLALAMTAVGADAQDGDPLREYQWGLDQVNAPDAWGTATGDGITIAVVDTGIDPDHEDLAGNVVGGATFLECGDEPCGDGHWLDHDGDGDDPEGDPHGTHVAGLAAAIAGNGVGIAGVAPDASIMPIKVLNASGGVAEDVARGIEWAVDNGADVINLSLGTLPGMQIVGPMGPTSDVGEAIERANANGVVVIGAAGNFSFPFCEEPAFREDVICVVATDAGEVRSIYSNLAIAPDQLSLAAPGGSLGGTLICYEDVLSTVPAGTGQDDCDDYPDSRAYGEMAGTSMSAPHVAGVAAMLLEHGCERDGAIDAMMETARNPHLGGERGIWDPAYGYGIVDAAAAVGGADAICLGQGGDGDDGFLDGDLDGDVTGTDGSTATPSDGDPSGAPDGRDHDDRSAAPSDQSSGQQASAGTQPQRGTLPQTGGGAAILGLLGLAAAVALMRGRGPLR